MLMNLKYKKNIAAYISKLSVFIIGLTVFRGIIALIVKNPNISEQIYNTITSIVLIISLFAFMKYFTKSTLVIDVKFHKLLTINFFLLSIVAVVSYFIDKTKFDISILYLIILPYIIYYFASIPERYVIFLLRLISIVIAFFVVKDYFSLNTNLINIGRQDAFETQQLLRPELESFTHTDGIYRAGGIQASVHDSGNLLGLLSIFWMAFYKRTNYKSIIYVIFSLITFLSMLLTQSGVNILITITLLILLNLQIMASHFLRFFFLAGLVTFLVIIFNTILPVSLLEISTTWLNRVNDFNSYGWSGMTGYGIREFPSSEVIHIFVGQAKATNSIIYKVEARFLKHLYDFGLIPFIAFYQTLLYPIFRYYFSLPNTKNLLMPYTYCILFGVISTIHYGSIFRMPNILILYLMFAMFFKLKAEVSYPVSNTLYVHHRRQ